MSKASELTELTTTPATGDYFVLVDVSDTTHAASGTTKRLEVGTLATLYSPVTIGVNGATEGGATFASLASEDWHVALGQQASYGQNDDILILGYNKTGINTFDDATAHSIYMVFEADYYTSPTEHVTEWYVEYRAGDGTLRRPVALTVDLDTDAPNIYFRGGFAFQDATGGTEFIDIDATTGAIRLTNSNSITMAANGVGFLRQRNAANSADIDLMFLNSANQVSIGQPVTMWGDILFNHNTNHGPVLIDRTTAANRRIVCDNGVLSTEAA